MSGSRVQVDSTHPALTRALAGLVTQVRMAADRQGVPRRLMELINVRASQLNGCARCLDVHIPKALEAGETVQRIGVLPAWRETELFDEVERAALEITESVTQDSGHLGDEDHARLRAVLGDERLALFAWIAITINSYNRVSILSGHQPRHRD